jgi:hypothetical protein
MAYSAYNAYLSSLSKCNDPAQYYKDNLQCIINGQFENSINYREITLLDRLTLIGTDIGVRLSKPNSMNGSADLKDDFFKVTFKNFDTEIVLGDLFEFDDYRWLVVDISSIDADVMPTITDDIISIDCVVEKKIYDIERDKYYILPVEELQAKIPNAPNGRKIKSGRSGGTRFLVGNPATAYSTIGTDSISLVRTDINSSNINNGIILLKIKIDTVNERQDNISEFIAKQRCYGGV